MAQKIVEILESGHLRNLDHINNRVPVLETFCNIWGAGVKTAQMWYHQVILATSAAVLVQGLLSMVCTQAVLQGILTCAYSFI